MNPFNAPHAGVIALPIALVLFLSVTLTQARTRRPPSGGRLAVIVDERLSALRESPDFSGKLLQRISRGRLVAIQRRRINRDGIVFYRVKLSTRTQGWIQKEALVSPGVVNDDERLLRLIRDSEGFDRLVRAQIFLTTFPRSRLRPEVLMIYAAVAEAAAVKLSRDAARRFDREKGPEDWAPEFSYYLNYSGLDRYNRQGITFVFDRRAKEFRYDGKAWHEIVRRYPRSVEAAEARRLLTALKVED